MKKLLMLSIVVLSSVGLVESKSKKKGLQAQVNTLTQQVNGLAQRVGALEGK